MKEKTKTRGIGFWALLILTGLVFAALLELNKNTLTAEKRCRAKALCCVSRPLRRCLPC